MNAGLNEKTHQGTYLSFELVIEVRVVELDKAEEQGSFLGDGVVLWNLLLHVLLQEGHVA